MRLAAFLLLLAACLPAQGVYAQARPDARFTHLTTAEGLSQSEVTGIVQDARGFLWIATTDGLNRYDGYSFTVYTHDPDDPNTPGDNYLHTILQDRDGHLWLGTSSGGLDRFDPRSETFTHFRHDPDDPNSPAGNTVNSLLQDAQGYLWIGTQNDGLDRLDPRTGTFTHYGPEPDGSTNFIMEIAEARGGGLWVAATVLQHLDPVTGRFTPVHGDRVQGIRDLYVDPQGLLWAGTTQGLARYDPATGALRVFAPAPNTAADASANHVDVIFPDDSLLWIGTPGGLYRFDPAAGAFTHHFRHDPSYPGSLSSDRIVALLRDRAGLLWVGTRDAGLNQLDRRRAQFVVYRHAPGEARSLPDRHVRAVHVDPDGTVWTGSSRGELTRFDRQTGRFTHYRHDPARPHSIGAGHLIGAVTRDRDGYVWVGGWEAGLNQLDPATGRFRRFRHDPADPYSISSNNVLSLCIDRSGALWVGTLYAGLNRFDPATGRFDVYRHDPSDPHSLGGNAVSTILEDRRGDLWVGSWAGVLSRLDRQTGRFTHYRYAPGMPGSLAQGSIAALYEDRTGTLWVGSAGGLSRFDRVRGTFERFTQKDGLPGSSVRSILEDDRGRLWLGTQHGLARFDPAARAFHTFDTADGLPANEFHSGAAGRGPGGELFFGTTDGLVSFSPDRVTTNPYVPPVMLTDLRILNTPVRPGPDAPLRQAIWATDTLTLTHHDYVFSLAFSALSYDAPEQNRYRYRLEGLETHWNEVGSTRRMAMYSNLAPGAYVFHVAGSNSDGVWNEEGARLHLRVLPPWWSTWWFRTLMVLFAVGSAATLYQLRVRSIERHRRQLAVRVAERTQALDTSNRELAAARDAAEAANRTKSLFLANMSHELRTPLNAILGFSELIRHDATLHTAHREHLDIIRDSGTHLLDLIEDVLDMSKIEAGRVVLDERVFDLHALLAGLEKPFALRAREKGVALTFTNAPGVPRFVHADERKLRQVLINLLTNAVKFTEHGRVDVRVGYPDGRLRVEVEDTGPGIAPGEADRVFQAFEQTESGRRFHRGTGLGLAISRGFVEEMDGRLDFESEVGRGTRFWFDVGAPEASAPAAAAADAVPPAAILAPGQPPPRLLVVDDDAVNRRLLVELFEAAGFAVREAADGAEAVTLAPAWRPHLVWMDERMPGMSGTRATRRLRALALTPRPVVVALTANALSPGAAEAAGYDEVVRKPCRPQALFDVAARRLGVAYAPAADTTAADTDAAGTPEPDGPPAPPDLSVLPPDLCAALHDAARLGRLDALETLVARISPEHRGLADHLKSLVDAIRLDILLDLTRPHAAPRAPAADAAPPPSR